MKFANIKFNKSNNKYQLTEITHKQQLINVTKNGVNDVVLGRCDWIDDEDPLIAMEHPSNLHFFTFSMLIIFAVLLCYLSSSDRKPYNFSGLLSLQLK